MLRFGILVFALLWAGLVCAQAPNDNIENRLELKLDSVVRSSTINCTVQRACIDETLTGKCVQYHNDQWFYFHNNAAEELYINLWGQRCRNLQGVQLVVIDGEPCNPSTYKVLSCTSLETQDDIYIKLSNLTPNHTYLLNIDGYLNDQCSFSLELSTKPKGLPVTTARNNLELSRRTENMVHTTTWKLNDPNLEDSVQEFVVLRRKATDAKARIAGTVSWNANSYGTSGNYSLTDTVEAGTYFYQIYAVKHNSEKVLLSQFQEKFTIAKSADYNNPENSITLNFPDKSRTPYDIFIYDAQTNILIRKDHFVASRKATTYQLRLPEKAENEVRMLRIVMHNLKNGSKREELIKSTN